MAGGIDGVVIKALKRVTNARGGLMEIQRADEPGFPGFGQVYVTQSLNGVVKAWYRHQLQIDQIAAITGLVKLVLYDSRPDSPTFERLDEVIMGEIDPKLVQIPAKVWHGFQAIGDRDAVLVHLNSRAFDFGNADEERLAPDDPFIPYSW